MKEFVNEYGLAIIGAIVAVIVLSFVMWAISDSGILTKLSNVYAEFIGGSPANE